MYFEQESLQYEWSFFHLFWMPYLIWRLGKWVPPLILLMWYFASPLCTEVSFLWPLFKLLVRSYLDIIDGSGRVLEQIRIIGYNNGRSRFEMSCLVQIKDLLLIHMLGTPTGIRFGQTMLYICSISLSRRWFHATFLHRITGDRESLHTIVVNW